MFEWGKNKNWSEFEIDQKNKVHKKIGLEIYSYTTVIVMCPKQKQNAKWSKVEIEMFIVRGRNLPRTNSTKSETQNIFGKKQQNEHTPAQNWALTYFFKRK